MRRCEWSLKIISYCVPNISPQKNYGVVCGGQMAALAWKAPSGLELASRQLKGAKEHAELRPGKERLKRADTINA